MNLARMTGIACTLLLIAATAMGATTTSTPASETASCLPRSVIETQRYELVAQMNQQLIQQRAQVAEMERYASWMRTTIVSYNKYIQAGSTAAAVSRFLPIPYAGQAALFSKLLAQFSANLTSTSLALNRYGTTAQELQSKISKLPTNHSESRDLQLLSVYNYTDQSFLPAMDQTQQELNRIAELSTSTLAFLQSLHHYLSSGDEYMQKVKGAVFKKDSQRNEMSMLTENVKHLTDQTAIFSKRLETFRQQGDQIHQSARTERVYQKLMTLMTTTQR